MLCIQVKKMLPEYVLGEMDDKNYGQIKQHLDHCENCRLAYNKLFKVSALFDKLPENEPDTIVKIRFYKMLTHFSATALQKRQQKFNFAIGNLWARRFVPQMAVAVISLFLGFLAGYTFSTNGETKKQFLVLQDQVDQMKQMVGISMLQQTSASERLRGVSYSRSIQQPDQTLLQTLLTALNTDPNVNVRLAVVDALYSFHNEPNIREQLVQSLSQQTSPLLQIALIDLLVDIREKKSLEALRTLISNQTVSDVVRQKAQWGIQQLL
ncbi:HEAT repeat domain-containing protein [candidate division KSB1 bacterium]|nr:HEAT repeat domain-containing protein [candidate division KSB1 bacterium]